MAEAPTPAGRGSLKAKTAREALRRAVMNASSDKAGVLELSSLAPADGQGAGREPEEAYLAELRRVADARCPQAGHPAGVGFDVIYINLEHRADRRSAMELSLERAGLRGARRFCACTGGDAPPWACTTHFDCTLNARFDRNSVAQGAVAMSAGERGCSMSHLLLWAQISALADDQPPVLVLEDDVELADDAGHSCAALIHAVQAALAPERRQLLLYLGADVAAWGSPDVSRVPRCGSGGGQLLLREARYVWCASSYVIWPAAARVLLRHLPVSGPADVHLSRLIWLRSVSALVVVPNLAKQSVCRTGEFGHGDIKASASAVGYTPCSEMGEQQGSDFEQVRRRAATSILSRWAGRERARLKRLETPTGQHPLRRPQLQGISGARVAAPLSQQCILTNPCAPGSLTWEESSFTEANWPGPDWQRAQKAATLRHVLQLPEGSGVIDCGAHIGDYGVPLALALQRCGRRDLTVYCIEPAADKCQFIRRMAWANGVEDSVRVISVGLSSQDGRFVSHEDSTGGSGASQWRPAARGSLFRRLDTMCAEGVIGEVGFMWLDCEFMEKQALLGGIKLLRRCRPTIVLEFTIPRRVNSLGVVTHSRAGTVRELRAEFEELRLRVDHFYAARFHDDWLIRFAPLGLSGYL